MVQKLDVLSVAFCTTATQTPYIAMGRDDVNRTSQSHFQGCYLNGGLIFQRFLKVDAETLATFRVDWHPSEDLPKWAITINPT